MKSTHSVTILVLTLALGGCVAPADEEGEPSDSALVEGATEGSSQTTASAVALRSGALLDLDLLRTSASVDVGLDAGPLLTQARQGPERVSAAAFELHRALVEERALQDAAAALEQLLSADPADASGAIAAVADGTCATFGGFLPQSSIAEMDPPLARLVIVHDSSAAPECRLDGTVHYDLRVVTNASGGPTLQVAATYPDGLSIQTGAGEPLLLGAGGAIRVGLAFDASNAFDAVVAEADYCVRQGAAGADLCFQDLSLAVSGAVSVTFVDGTCATCGGRYGDAFVDSLAGDGVRMTVGGSVVLEALGAVTYGDLGLAFGDGSTPIALEVGFDSTDGWFAVLDGDVTTTVGGDVATYGFAAIDGAPMPGFWVTKPIGELALTFDGCAARTVDTRTTSLCLSSFDLVADEGTRAGAIRVTASGDLVYTTPTRQATYGFEAASADVLGRSVILGGRVTRTNGGGTRAVLFEGFEIVVESADAFALSGVVETQRDGARVVRADFCGGSTYVWDDASETLALAGCVELASPRYGTLALGEAGASMSVSLAPDLTTIDGPLTYHGPSGRRIATIGFDGWRAEDLDDGTAGVDAHRRITGRATLDVLGIRGSVESTTGVEIRLTSDATAETNSVQLDGDLGVAIDAGAQTVSGSVTFTGYQATFLDQMEGHRVGHLGVIDMDVTLGSGSLPSPSMRLTFGAGTDPLITTTTEALTTIEGHVIVGVGCASGTCNENIDMVLSGVAFETPECGRQHPHTGTARISGLNPSTSAIVPALRVRCDCRGGPDRETLLPRRVTMVFTDATPTDRRIQIPEARGVCGLRLNATCNAPGAAWLRNASVCTGG